MIFIATQLTPIKVSWSEQMIVNSEFNIKQIINLTGTKFKNNMEKLLT